MHRLLVAFAWLTMAVIVFATLSPLGLRPETGSVWFEHFFAYLLAAGLLGLAYPRQLTIVSVGIIAIAIALELAQFLTPDRHGRLVDLVQKLLGAVVGLLVAYLMRSIRSRRQRI